MQLSCLPVSLYDDLTAGRKTLSDWLVFANELGLDGADVSVAHLQNTTSQDQNNLRQQADSLGIQIAMVVTYTDFTHPDDLERAKQIDTLREHIAIAARLGASFLRVTAGQAHPGVTRSDGIRWAVEGLQACLDDADQANVTLAYENHTIGYGWIYVDFSQPADIFCEIVAYAQDYRLKLLFDTANTLARGDDPLQVLERVKDRIAVIHVNDIRQAGVFEPVVIGAGVSPIDKIFSAMKTTGFDGWISLEEASKTGKHGFQAGVDYIRKIWQTNS